MPVTPLVPKPEPTPVERVLRVPASPMFMALLDRALDNPTPRSTPEVVSMSITSDGFLMASNDTNPAVSGFIGHVSDFDRNLDGICRHAGLTDEQTQEVRTHAYSQITDFRA